MLQPRYWYLMLIVLSSIIFAYALWKKRDSRLIPLYSFMGGLTYLFEAIILVWLGSYRYHPHILKEPYFDSVLGAVISDAFVIPLTAAFIAAFNLNFWQLLIPVGLITGIEVLFEQLGIFELFWWKHYYTVVGSFTAFYLAKGWYQLLKKPRSISVQFVTLYLTDLLLQASVAFILAVAGKFLYSVSWFVDPIRSHVAFATVEIVILSCIFVPLVIFSLNWPWVIGVIGLVYLKDLLLLKLNILHLSEGWSLGHFIIMYFILYIALLYFNRIFLGNKQPRIKVKWVGKKV